MLNESFGFIFRALVYGQVFFWLWLYDQDWLNTKIPEHIVDLFMFACPIGFALFVAWNRFGISQYTPTILIQYCFLYVLGWIFYKVKFSWVQALSLMGLTVFLNSYYWESILHIQEIKLVGGFTPNMILQLVHLLPTWFFMTRFSFEKNRALNDLMVGFLISAIIGFITIRYLATNPFSLIIPAIYRNTIKQNFFFLNRVSCLMILIKVIFDAEPK